LDYIVMQMKKINREKCYWVTQQCSCVRERTYTSSTAA